MRILSVDIGGTFIKYAVMDEMCRFIEKGKVPTPQSGHDELIEAIASLYEKFHAPAGIALSMPGIIDPRLGYVKMGGALEYNNDFFIRNALEKRTGCRKITVYNDAKCAAQAEVSLGALKGVQNGAVMLFGTMIGGGLVLDGKVRQGSHFSAGEVSYILTDRNCVPSHDTVWGRTCSALRLCRDYAEKKNLRAEAVDGEAVFEALEKGDMDAEDALYAYAKEIAVQFFNFQTLLDLERFAIGGGISAQPRFIEAIRACLDKMYTVSPYYTPRPEIVRCQFGSDANLIGALQYWLEAEF